jgi:methylated-DNA-[protein]-cysteine S-methyltransferase
MAGIGFALFDTAIGRCGIVWSPAGILGLQLPEASEAAARARLRRRFPAAEEIAPPPAVAAAIARIAAHLAGRNDDLRDVELALDAAGDGDRRVYAAARLIPPGTTVTYGELAAHLGNPGAARAVGQALGRNPWPIVIPCHRVTAADGRTGGFSAPGGAATKLKLLEIEGALAADSLPLFAHPV